jgi:hypothetical protein
MKNELTHVSQELDSCLGKGSSLIQQVEPVLGRCQPKHRAANIAGLGSHTISAKAPPKKAT